MEDSLGLKYRGWIRLDGPVEPASSSSRDKMAEFIPRTSLKAGLRVPLPTFPWS